MVVQSSQAGSATAAEKLGFKQGLESILEDVKVDCVATDGHTGMYLPPPESEGVVALCCHDVTTLSDLETEHLYCRLLSQRHNC